MVVYAESIGWGDYLYNIQIASTPKQFNEALLAFIENSFYCSNEFDVPVPYPEFVESILGAIK